MRITKANKLGLDPEQYIIFSSSDDSVGVGNLEIIQAKDIISWKVDPDDDNETGTEVTYKDENGDNGLGYIYYFDYIVLPKGCEPKWEQSQQLDKIVNPDNNG